VHRVISDFGCGSGIITKSKEHFAETWLWVVGSYCSSRRCLSLKSQGGAGLDAQHLHLPPQSNFHCWRRPLDRRFIGKFGLGGDSICTCLGSPGLQWSVSILASFIRYHRTCPLHTYIHTSSCPCPRLLHDLRLWSTYFRCSTISV